MPGDADRLQRLNLLSNAAKFTPSGESRRRLSHGNSNVQIQVSDSGPGINPAFLPHVFERFRQADGTTTRTYGGLGLGLAIVRHLVELHGGIITAENRAEGPGAIFTVMLRLPSGEPRPEALSGATPAIKDSDPEPPSLENLHILVVDDERDTLDLVTMDLHSMGPALPSHQRRQALSALEHSHRFVDHDTHAGDGRHALIRQVRNENRIRRKTSRSCSDGLRQRQDRMRAIVAGYNARCQTSGSQ